MFIIEKLWDTSIRYIYKFFLSKYTMAKKQAKQAKTTKQIKQSQPQAGDFVEVKKGKEIIEGTLLESYEPNLLLLKLKSGYNIGIKKSDITDIKILNKYKEKKEQELEIKRKNNLKDIAILTTGGTISARLDYKTGGVSWLTNPEMLFKFYPKLFDIANVKKIEVPFMIATDDISGKEWQEIAKTAFNMLNDENIHGLIITQGTDFLHYTSAILSFFLRNLKKPVVLTYSQRSTDRGSSDASLNLECAAQAAVSDIAEVMLVGHANLNDNFCYALPGTKVRKMHTSRRDTFRPINALPFAKIWPDKIEKLSDYRTRELAKKQGNFELDNKFEDKVALIKVFPGQKPDILDFYAKNGYKGIVVEASGLGHVPVAAKNHSWLAKLKKVISDGLIVCAAPQTLYGRLDPYVYSPARQLLDAGVIYLGDMLPETALVKLGWVLAKTRKHEEVKEFMLKNFCHELNPRLTTQEFLY